jgi:hypothetical protein
MSDHVPPAYVPTVASFEELYRREMPAVIALAYVLSGSRMAAEELAQDRGGPRRGGTPSPPARTPFG